MNEPTSDDWPLKPDAPGDAPPPVPKTVAGAWLRGVRADLKVQSVGSIALRALRRGRAARSAATYRALANLNTFRQHVAAEGQNDPLFFLGERHYLARGLGPAARAEAALTHYQHEQGRFGTAYFEAVYRDGGLVLWQDQPGRQRYDVILCPGNDVAHEGGLSLVLHVDGARVCVISFSVVPTAIVLPGYKAPALRDTTLFITRKQLTQDRSYQADFNRTYHRCTPAHMVLGALAGVAQAQGQSHAVGIAGDRHPSCTEASRARFKTAYTEFWLTLAGERRSPFGYLIDLPPRLSPLEGMDATHRKRALVRRRHVEAVFQSAARQMDQSLTTPA